MKEELKDQSNEKQKDCSIYGEDIRCSLCGGETMPAGHCRVCLNCGSSTGCG